MGQKNPPGQRPDGDDDPAGQYVPPAPHGKHAVGAVAPVTLLKYPTVQVVQVDVAIPLLKVPVGHGVHNVDAPMLGLKVPAGHWAHVDRPVVLA